MQKGKDMDVLPHAGNHVSGWYAEMDRQTFILVSNRPLGVSRTIDGGRNGYSVGSKILPWYIPPSNSVSGGPRMVKCHSKRLSCQLVGRQQVPRHSASSSGRRLTPAFECPFNEQDRAVHTRYGSVEHMRARLDSGHGPPAVWRCTSATGPRTSPAGPGAVLVKESSGGVG